MSETYPGHSLKPEVRRAVGRPVIRSAVGIVVYGLVLFGPAGRLDWGWGWVMLAVLAGVMAAQPLLVAPLNPGVLAEREKGMWNEGVKPWDKWITSLAGGLMFLVWITAGLDVRFGWTGAVGLAYHLGGLLAALAGYGLFLWAMASNPFFSQGVRIQAERGHAVATSGPYRYVRHPGYSGTILAHLGAPFLLGSGWALVPAGLLAALFVVRAGLEDRTLRAELPGYQVYAGRTPARLLPGVW